MTQRRRWRTALGLLALGVIGIVLLLRTDRAAAMVCEQLRTRLPEALGADVLIGRCEIDPLSASVEVHELSVTPHGAAAPLLTAERASVSLRGLFPGGIALQDVSIASPRVDLTIEPPTADGKPGRCPLDTLKQVRVGRLELTDGSVKLRLPGGREARVEGLTLRASLSRRQAELTLDGRAGSLRLDAQRVVNLGRLSVELGLDLVDRQLEVQRADANVEGVTVSVSGQIDALCDAAPQLALSGQVYAPIDALPRLGVPLPAPSGQLLSRISVGGRADALAVRADVQGSQVVLGPYSPGDFSARLAWSGKKVTIEEFNTRSGDGDVRVSGELSLDEGLPVKARVETRDASFARIMARAGVPGAWVEFPASVKGTLSGRLLPKPSLGGDIDFRTGRFVLASRAFDAPPTQGTSILGFAQSSGSFRLGINDQGVSFDDIIVRVGPQAATRVGGSVKLFYEEAKGLDIVAIAEAVDLSDFGSIAEMPWAGAGTARVRVSGPYSRVAIDGQTTLRDFKLRGYSLGVVQSPIAWSGETLAFPSIVAQKGQTQYFGDVSLVFRESGLLTRATMQLPDGRVEDVVDLLADLSPTMQTLQQGVLTGRLSALAAIDSPASQLTGVIAARVRDVEYYQRRMGAANLITRFDNGVALVLEPTVFEGPLGRVSADGRWRFDGPLDFRLGVEDGSTAELIDPKGVDQLPVGGVFTASAKVGGDVDTMLVDGRFSSPEVTWKGRSLGASRLEAHVVGRDLQTSGVVFPGLNVALTSKMKNDWPFDATLSVDLSDLSPFLPESAREVAVKARGTVRATGPLAPFAMAATNATAHLDTLSLSRGEVSAANVEPVELGWNTGAILVRSLKMKGPTMELAAEGSWGPATVDLNSRGSVDLRLLSSFVSAVERTQGRLDFTASFSGPMKAPALAGNAEVSDLRFMVKGEDVQVRSLSARADFSESRVLIDSVQGFVNDGRLRARGDARLDRFSLKTFELQTDLEDVTVQVQPDVPVTVSGSLLLATRNASLWQLSGGIDVQKFRYTKPLALESLLATARSRGVPSDAKPEEWLRYDVDIATAGDVRIENNLARARLLGKLKLGGTNVKPVLIGAVEAGEGAQAFFRGNTFSIQRGLLQFNGLWPTFDLSAQTQVREYLVSVKAFGRFEDPKVALSSEPGLPDTDILSLLTLGVTSRERITERGGASLAAEALLSASGLDQQVQRFLSQNVGLKDQQVRLTTSFNEATGTAEPSVTWESKVVSDNLKVGVTQPVTGRGTKAQAEYRFNQRVSARAQWDNQNQNTTVGNPGVDLRFRFEWE